eukprot:11362311-Prorocentrum_lima.AAC.1
MDAECGPSPHAELPHGLAHALSNLIRALAFVLELSQDAGDNNHTPAGTSNVPQQQPPFALIQGQGSRARVG